VTLGISEHSDAQQPDAASGCGTVARCTVGLHRPTAGNIVFDGVDVGRLKQRKAMAPIRRRMQMIFQDPIRASTRAVRFRIRSRSSAPPSA